MPRNSFLRLLPSVRSSWGSSKASGTDSSPGFFYPPLEPVPDLPMTFSSPIQQPHPYQLATVSVPVEPPSPQRTEINHSHVPLHSNHLRSDEPPKTSIAHSEIQETHCYRASSSSQHAPSFIRRMRSFFMLIVFLPIPPLISLLHMLIGHVVLRHVHPLPDTSWQVTLISSVGAGATGGIILSVPLALLSYLLIYSTKPSVAPADFFDDDDESIFTRQPLVRYSTYVICVVLLFCIGGASGALGVACIDGGMPGGQPAMTAARKTLSTGRAAVAGLVGGALLSGGVLVLMGVSFLVWDTLMRNR